MGERIKEGSQVFFDWNPEFMRLQAKIADILATYRPDFEGTVPMILNEVAHLVEDVENAWRNERAHQAMEDAGLWHKTFATMVSNALEQAQEEEAHG